MEFFSKSFVADGGREVRVHLWDTAGGDLQHCGVGVAVVHLYHFLLRTPGQERYHSLARCYYRAAAGGNRAAMPIAAADASHATVCSYLVSI